MSSAELKRITDLLFEPVSKIGNYMVKEQLKLKDISITHKSLNSLVSNVDVTAEKMIVEELKNILPDAGFLTEEETIVTEEKEWTWIIDPLDGTTNFLHNLPHFAISIGLAHKGEMVLGIIYDCSRQEYFSASHEGGAWLNRKQIFVKQNNELKDALLATGFPYYDFDKMDNYLSVLSEMMRSTRGLRRFGSAALDLAWVACGRYDGFFEYGLNPWDVAGGIVLVREAGGEITDFRNGDSVKNGKEILATNKFLHSELLEKIGKQLSA